MNLIIRPCHLVGQATSDDPGADSITCCWCLTKCPSSELAETVVPLCRACRVVTVKCKKCNATAQKDVRKSLQAFSLVRLQQWKRNRLLTSRAVCLQCDPQDHINQKPTRQQSLYTCMVCRQELQPKRFDPGVLRRAEGNQELHLLECKGCAAPVHGAGLQQPAAAACIGVLGLGGIPPVSPSPLDRFLGPAPHSPTQNQSGMSPIYAEVRCQRL